MALSSSAHLFGPVVFDDIDDRFRVYDPLSAYAQSKTAEILFAVGATHRWAEDGIVANAVNPGAIATPLQRHVGGNLVTPIHLQRSVQQGASTTVLAAVSPLLEGIGGRYFNDNTEATSTDRRDPARKSSSPPSRRTASTRTTPNGCGRCPSAFSGSRTPHYL